MSGLSTERLAEAVSVRPSARQLAWQELEFIGFIHFGMNTMTDREWGLGHEDPALFDPAGVDAVQWVDALADAGMRGVILTCKHHDGFALWPSAHSEHTVAASPWREGRGDLVREVSDACRARGLRFGVYLSPWDRTESSYGSGAGYDDFFVAQLTELLTNYGEIFDVWLDGANGEGPNGKRQYYDWDRYFALVRELQPDAVISVCGPDVRWCGNEAGVARADEWSVVPASLRDAERTAEKSQQADDGEFSRQVASDEDDLGSRAALAATADDLVWYPAEVNTSIRHGWFHHPAEDRAVRGVDELFDIYRSSVGGNAVFLLNVPPTREGLVHDVDVARLRELGARIAGLRERAIDGVRSVSSGPTTPGAVGADSPPWHPTDDDAAPAVVIDFAEPREIAEVIVRERIQDGQRVEGIAVRITTPAGETRAVATAGSVGYQRIVTFPPVAARRVEIILTASRATPSIAAVSVLSS